ncbi:hypothetical protein ALC60_00133 [Trachymyrmex zeteki]|uniref:Uncharacterized protein n=1 Tax=Mycetomoellerius zeteki TaxID=64791 RepID=A0A151XK62_9HYME|nr:hypothetical protein ALC60_00133 [Trachymyrmex zeteki]
MSTNKWKRQKERKTIAKTARIGNRSKEENKILSWDISRKREKKAKSGFPMYTSDVQNVVQFFLEKSNRKNPFVNNR